MLFVPLVVNAGAPAAVFPLGLRASESAVGGVGVAAAGRLFVPDTIGFGAGGEAAPVRLNVGALVMGAPAYFAYAALSTLFTAAVVIVYILWLRLTGTYDIFFVVVRAQLQYARFF